ncbi:smalltalk protein [Bacteroides clarus]|mgnify:CR=1 FL=1
MNTKSRYIWDIILKTIVVVATVLTRIFGLISYIG